jgi:Putative peptidoglycan binding domain
MKLYLTVSLMLLGGGQLVFGDDQPKSQPASSRPRSSSPVAAVSSPNSPRPVQPIVRRPIGTPVNPNVRSVHPAAAVNPRFLPNNRVTIPSNNADATGGRNRSARDSASVNPNAAAKPRQPLTTRTLGARTGRELSFAQARAQCSREFHSRDWWRHHHVLVVFYGGGYWFWNAGWWFPAWGYDPFYSNYVYDGPIYGFGQSSPGDVTAQVQEALAQQGYYYGAIDGVLGPETRDAILRFQADHGLATTAAIDEPTLNTLGLT